MQMLLAAHVACVSLPFITADVLFVECQASQRIYHSQGLALDLKLLDKNLSSPESLKIFEDPSQQLWSRASFYHEDSRSTISEYPPMSFSRVQPQLQYPSQNHAGHGLSERRLGRQIQGQDSGRLGGIQRGRSRVSFLDAIASLGLGYESN